MDGFGEAMLRQMGYNPEVRATKPCERMSQVQARPCHLGLGASSAKQRRCSKGGEDGLAPVPATSDNAAAAATKFTAVDCALPGAEGGVVSADSAVETEMEIYPGSKIYVLEAGLKQQNALVEQARGLEGGSTSAQLDPYGVVLWPAALVVAREVVAWVISRRDQPRQPKAKFDLLELGSGCGLVALVAAREGLKVLATDFRHEPLQLLRSAAQRQQLEVQTALLDLREHETQPLPSALIVVASDLLYDVRLGRALARRVAEARLQGAEVMVGDPGRLGRDAFLDELQTQLPHEHAEFVTRCGIAVCGPRNAAFIDPLTRSVPGSRLAVGLLRLPQSA